MSKITFIPSSTNTEVSNDEDDSIEITPSGPIFAIASANKFPTNSSFPAETDATAAKRELGFNACHFLKNSASSIIIWISKS